IAGPPVARLRHVRNGELEQLRIIEGQHHAAIKTCPDIAQLTKNLGEVELRAWIVMRPLRVAAAKSEFGRRTVADPRKGEPSIVGHVGQRLHRAALTPAAPLLPIEQQW